MEQVVKYDRVVKSPKTGITSNLYMEIPKENLDDVITALTKFR